MFTLSYILHPFANAFNCFYNSFIRYCDEQPIGVCVREGVLINELANIIKMKLFITLILFPIIVFSQHDSARFVRTYFDKYLNITDSAKSVYVGYEFYLNQRPLYFRTYMYVDKHVKMKPLKYELTEGKPILINDTLTWNVYNRKGILKGIEYRIYCNGFLIYESYTHCLNDGTPAYNEVREFSIKYKNQTGSYYGYYKTNDGKIFKKYWFCNTGNNKWTWVDIE